MLIGIDIFEEIEGSEKIEKKKEIIESNEMKGIKEDEKEKKGGSMIRKV